MTRTLLEFDSTITIGEFWIFFTKIPSSRSFRVFFRYETLTNGKIPYNGVLAFENSLNKKKTNISGVKIPLRKHCSQPLLLLLLNNKKWVGIYRHDSKTGNDDIYSRSPLLSKSVTKTKKIKTNKAKNPTHNDIKDNVRLIEWSQAKYEI